mmetsp:Transcript_17897/g.61742  ORF Transcript_17897/g.61742 Transcript_17897/m.61742 type:complete len:207 (-) Transcript_17897:975-1595(-)
MTPSRRPLETVAGDSFSRRPPETIRLGGPSLRPLETALLHGGRCGPSDGRWTSTFRWLLEAVSLKGLSPRPFVVPLECPYGMSLWTSRSAAASDLAKEAEPPREGMRPIRARAVWAASSRGPCLSDVCLTGTSLRGPCRGPSSRVLVAEPCPESCVTRPCRGTLPSGYGLVGARLEAILSRVILKSGGTGPCKATVACEASFPEPL